MAQKKPTNILRVRYDRLRRIAQEGGRDVSGWKLEPKRIGSGWRLTWTPPHFKSNNTVVAELGSDQYSAYLALDGLAQLYRQQVRAERDFAEKQAQRAKPGAFVVKNPNAPTQELRLAQQLISLIQKYGKWGAEQHGGAQTAALTRIAEMQAGILNMSMRQYAETQMAAVFGRPPASEKELKWMKSQLAAYQELQKQSDTRR